MNKYSFFTTKLIIICLVLGIDQASKYYYIESLSSGPQMINNYVNLHLMWNKGVSFGIFGHSQYSNSIFIILSSIITAVIAGLSIKSRNFLEATSYTLIVGGALGNLFDRFERGAVADFVQLHYNEYYFATFNFADSAISLGAGMLLIYFYKERKIDNK